MSDKHKPPAPPLTREQREDEAWKTAQDKCYGISLDALKLLGNKYGESKKKSWQGEELLPDDRIRLEANCLNEVAARELAKPVKPPKQR